MKKPGAFSANIEVSRGNASSAISAQPEAAIEPTGSPIHELREWILFRRGLLMGHALVFLRARQGVSAQKTERLQHGKYRTLQEVIGCFPQRNQLGSFYAAGELATGSRLLISN
jgi:hypothetical protein